jgi:hypothetical protein
MPKMSEDVDGPAHVGPRFLPNFTMGQAAASACVKKAAEFAQRIKGLCTCIRTDRMQYVHEGRPTEPITGSPARVYASDSVLMNMGS